MKAVNSTCASRALPWFVASCAIFFLTACSLFERDLAKPSCVPEFPLKDGWLGGDGISSVALGDGRILWLFGDTFVGSQTDRDRTHAKMIANSAGLSECRENGWSIEYSWRQDTEPRAIFASARGEEKYWPMSGVLRDNGEVLIFLARVRTVKKGDPFGFRLEGADIAVLRPENSPPQNWPMQIVPIYAGTEWIIGSSAIRRGDTILLLAAKQTPTKEGSVMALFKLAAAGDAFKLQALNEHGTWHTFPGIRPRELFADGSSEAGLAMDAEQKWLLVHSQGGFAAPQIMLRYATDLEGPWSAASPIARYAEMTIGDPLFRSGVFCYAAKAHPEFSNGNSLFVTYACNSADERILEQDLTIYRPRIIRVNVDPTSVPIR
jgi:hypothetical protein